MGESDIKLLGSSLDVQDLRRRKREYIAIAALLIVVAVLTFFENRVIHIGADFPIYNTILMFILININLLLLILLLYLVLRNLVKLLYDRKRKVMGSKLRTRLVVAFIALTLLPSIILFFFSITFITDSMEFWFSVPVEQALENSLDVGREIYKKAEEEHRHVIELVLRKPGDYLIPRSTAQEALLTYAQAIQKEHGLGAVELYDANAKRLASALSPELAKKPFRSVAADHFQNSLAADTGFLTFSENSSTGELVRTIKSVPIGDGDAQVNGFIVFTTPIRPDLSVKIATISKGFEEYQQIKLLKKPIAITFYIILSIVALLVLFCAIWFGFYMAKTITTPIRELADGTRRVAEGDLGFRIDMVADDEIGSLVDSFNQMTQDLRKSREQLETSARLLREQNISNEERRRYMEIVLRNVSAGVVTLDAEGAIATINTSAERMLSLTSEDILNRRYLDVLPEEYLQLADNLLEQLNTAKADAIETVLKVAIAGIPRSFFTHINSLADDSGNPLGTVIVFDDLTELEKAQRMAAWREVARRIAHEVKNPLTPIKLSAQRLKRRYSKTLNEAIFEECTEMIIDHVELLRNIVNEFATFASFPTANPQPCDLPATIEETLALYREGHENVDFQLDIVDDIPVLSLDREQIKQATINLIDNSIAAVKGAGAITITVGHDPILKMVILEVADDGSGVSDEDKTRMFEPNFSTKKTGMGLGLTIVSTIIGEHNGRIRVQDNQPKGAKFVIELPA